jgi:serine/threonine protein phosphatase PrpC
MAPRSQGYSPATHLTKINPLPPPQLSPSKSTAITALNSAFTHTNSEVMKVTRWSHQGSTAVVCYVHFDPSTKKSTLITGNVGDSRAVLSRDGKAIDASKDHKPNDKRERERIEKLGGKVSLLLYILSQRQNATPKSTRLKLPPHQPSQRYPGMGTVTSMVVQSKVQVCTV